MCIRDRVTTANDGEEGLDKFNQVKPDMVLLDVMIPKICLLYTSRCV